ncbi:MAG: tetratricopeptide repeat protein [Woeseia sp.]
MPDRIKALLQMLERGQESALLRFSLGNEYFGIGEYGAAIQHLQRAVEMDSHYSAAWKLLGRSLAMAGRNDEAISAYRKGIEKAGQQGDRQAAKEMTVFLKRLLKARDSDG